MERYQSVYYDFIDGVEENLDEETELTKIPANTEIHVWSEVTNNFVEITYQINETNLVNTYILKCYDALKHLDETEFVSNLEEYCKSNGIEIPFAHNNAVDEIE